MHPELAVRRPGVLNTKLEDHKTALQGWLDTLDSHLYRLYLITGKDDFAKALPLIRRLREETTAVDGTSLEQAQGLQELGEQHRGDVGGAHGQARMAGFGCFDGVHGEDAHGVRQIGMGDAIGAGGVGRGGQHGR